jgi:hypothetical protein
MKKLSKKNMKINGDKINNRYKFFKGNDFEAFVYDNEKKCVANAIEVLNHHGKDNPYDLGNDVKCFNDNLLLEFTIKPYSSKEEMISTLKDAFNRVQKLLGDRYSLVWKAGHFFDEKDVQSEEAKLVGCMPSFDAYQISVVNPEPFTNTFRSSGGHFHVSGKPVEDFKKRLNAVKLNDIYLGCANVLHENNPLAVERRKKYGAAGNHRCPAHKGYEYRSLSSYFLNSKELTELNYDLLDYSLSHIENGTDEDILKLVDENMVKDAINTCSAKKALKVLQSVKLPADLMKRIEKKYNLDNFYESWGIKV